MSTRPHANITVDYSEAVKMEGVAAYVGAHDVPGSNFIGKYSRLWTPLMKGVTLFQRYFYVARIADNAPHCPVHMHKG